MVSSMEKSKTPTADNTTPSYYVSFKCHLGIVRIILGMTPLGGDISMLCKLLCHSYLYIGSRSSNFKGWKSYINLKVNSYNN